jgi:hypothetical protein
MNALVLLLQALHRPWRLSLILAATSAMLLFSLVPPSSADAAPPISRGEIVSRAYSALGTTGPTRHSRLLSTALKPSITALDPGTRSVRALSFEVMVYRMAAMPSSTFDIFRLVDH